MDFEEESGMYVSHDEQHVVISVYTDLDDEDEEMRMSFAILPELAYQLAREITKAAIEVEEGEDSDG